MSLTYSLTFVTLSAACVLGWVVATDLLGRAALAFLYAALSFGLLAVAYAGAGARVLLKRASGRRSAWAWVWFGPYFALNAVTFVAFRRMSGEPAFTRVATNLYFGRRLTAGEAETLACDSVLDLAGEFAEVRPLRQRANYKSLPVLDATAPTDAQLREAVAWVARRVQAGPVYVHCALGHGRTATVVVAYLLTTGQVRSVREGVRLLRSLRPGVGLNAAQRRRLRSFEQMRADLEAANQHDRGG